MRAWQGQGEFINVRYAENGAGRYGRNVGIQSESAGIKTEHAADEYYAWNVPDIHKEEK